MAAVAADPRPRYGGGLMVLCRLCAAGLSVTGAALVLLSSAGMRVVAATDGTTVAVEDLEGPWGRRSGPPVLTPIYSSSATGGRCSRRPPPLRGWPSVFAFPLRADRVTYRVLDLYRATPGGLTDQALRRRRRGPPRPPSCC